MDLKRKELNILRYLAAHPGVWISPGALPDGNGRAGGASGAVLKALRHGGLIEYGREPQHVFSGYRRAAGVTI